MGLFKKSYMHRVFKESKPLCVLFYLIPFKTRGFLLHVVLDIRIINAVNAYLPLPVAVQSKAWVCVRLLAGIVGSNPSRGRNVCLL
jgi:hypothetical protein